jgi:SIR2-like domain
MNYILLLGAGFSRNWGGWLANEAFEYLLGVREISEHDHLKALLWKYRRTGGFEAALAEIQAAWSDDYHQHLADPERRFSHPKDHLDRFQIALEKMFGDMNRAFQALTEFEFQSHAELLVRRFLTRFDAIFTLNQDLLLEYHYLNDNVQLSSNGKWNGWQIPGMQKSPHLYSGAQEAVIKWAPLPVDRFKVEGGNQPYFKLHGSSEWRAGSVRDLMIMGGNKDHAILSHEILKWYFREFSTRLAKPGTRLMVIGYSFGDAHINRAIIDAAKTKQLGIFIIDPSGSDVISNTNRIFVRQTGLYTANELETVLHPAIIGASRRSMREIFGANAAVEHNKVMRFFD